MRTLEFDCIQAVVDELKYSCNVQKFKVAVLRYAVQFAFFKVSVYSVMFRLFAIRTIK